MQQPTGTRDIKYRDDLNKDPQGARIQAICNMPEVNQQKVGLIVPALCLWSRNNLKWIRL